MFEDEPRPFDLGALAAALDAKRSELGLSWAELARKVGVSVSTLRRFSHADDAEADGVLCVLGWLDVTPETYVSDSTVPGQKLPTPDGGVIRIDMAELSRLNEFSYGSKRRSRTTIQRLVGAAQNAGLPVAALTKRSQF